MLELLGSFGAEMAIPIELDGQLTCEELAATGVGLPIQIRAYYGDAEGVRELLNRDPAAANPEALEWAAGRGHEEIVQLLLRHAPELAAHVTVGRPREMAELLIEHGMDPNRPNWLRKTPLMEFAASGDVESAALFLEHGADLQARDEEMCSPPLAWAAMHGRVHMVEFLLSRGARQELPEDPPWATPLAWAERRGHDEVVRLLTEHRRTGALPQRSLAGAEALARDLVDAYGPGGEPALLRVMRRFDAERALAWDRPPREVLVERFRRGLADRLRQIPGAGAPRDTLALEDARLFVARTEGYPSWDALVRALTTESESG